MDMLFIREREREREREYTNPKNMRKQNWWEKKKQVNQKNKKNTTKWKWTLACCTMHGVIWSLQARLFFSQVFSPNWRDCILMGLKKKTSKPHQFLPIFFSYQTYQNIIFPPFFFSHLFSILSKIQMDKFKNVVIKA